MPEATINGVRLFYESTGSGPTLVLVHGALGDHRNWDAVVPGLARTCRVVTYDRRGHSQSERLPDPGTIDEDVEDLAGLIRRLHDGPVHIVGSSSGASIVLRLAMKHPGLFATLTVHEPPLLGLLGELPVGTAVKERLAAVAAKLQTGDLEGGTRQFMDTVAIGPGAWEAMPDATRRKLLFNAPTFVDELRDTDAFTLDLSALSRFDHPAMLTQGEESLPYFAPIVDLLAQCPAFGQTAHLRRRQACPAALASRRVHTRRQWFCGCEPPVIGLARSPGRCYRRRRDRLAAFSEWRWHVVRTGSLAPAARDSRLPGQEASMPGRTLTNRVEILERKMESLAQLPDRVAALESQILQFREDVRAEFLAVRGEMKGLHGVAMNRIDDLHVEMHALHDVSMDRMHGLHDLAMNQMHGLHDIAMNQMRELHQVVVTQMRVLHEDVISRIALLSEGEKGAKPAG